MPLPNLSLLWLDNKGNLSFLLHCLASSLKVSGVCVNTHRKYDWTYRQKKANYEQIDKNAPYLATVIVSAHENCHASKTEKALKNKQKKTDEWRQKLLNMQEQLSQSRAISADKKTSYTDRSSQQNPTARMVSDNHLWHLNCVCMRVRACSGGLQWFIFWFSV